MTTIRDCEERVIEAARRHKRWHETSGRGDPLTWDEVTTRMHQSIYALDAARSEAKAKDWTKGSADTFDHAGPKTLEGYNLKDVAAMRAIADEQIDKLREKMLDLPSREERTTMPPPDLEALRKLADRYLNECAIMEPCERILLGADCARATIKLAEEVERLERKCRIQGEEIERLYLRDAPRARIDGEEGKRDG